MECFPAGRGALAAGDSKAVCYMIKIRFHPKSLFLYICQCTHSTLLYRLLPVRLKDQLFAWKDEMQRTVKLLISTGCSLPWKYKVQRASFCNQKFTLKLILFLWTISLLYTWVECTCDHTVNVFIKWHTVFLLHSLPSYASDQASAPYSYSFHMMRKCTSISTYVNE